MSNVIAKTMPHELYEMRTLCRFRSGRSHFVDPDNVKDWATIAVF